MALLGPPGAGKGTQAQFVAAHRSVPTISTGEIFRQNVSQGTDLGLQVKRYLDAGDLVPDEVTIAMIRDRLAEDDTADGFLLHGFPATVPQAAELDGMLAEIGAKLDAVLQLVVDDEEIIRRLDGRRTCRTCGHIWHLDFEPTIEEGFCDNCEGELFQRDDDLPETIRHRLDVYAEQTAPLVAYYADQGILAGIDATGPVEDVTDRAIEVLRHVDNPGRSA